MRAYLHVDVDGSPKRLRPTRPQSPRLRKARPHRGYALRQDRRLSHPPRRAAPPSSRAPHDPYPGYYISTTAFYNPAIDDERNPRRYLDATHVNYVVLGDFGHAHHVKLGDLAAVYSSRTRKSVFAIVGDDGNASGCEGSLALVRALGYPISDGKEDSVDDTEITIRYYPGSNPKHTFLNTQAKIDATATSLGLSKRF